jgi:hypothetical protein
MAAKAQTPSSMAQTLWDVPGRNAWATGASEVFGGAFRAHPRGVSFVVRHASISPRDQLVIQPVIPCSFSIEAPMEQIQLPLLCRLDAPSVVPPHLVVQCKTYREAVRLCWDLRKARDMTKAILAMRAGLYAPHVTCYLEETKLPRDLPGHAVKAFEAACNNTAITQWHNLNAKLTCVEELQAMRAIA